MAGMVREPGTIGRCLPGRPIRTDSRGSRCSTGRRRWRRCRASSAALGGRAEIWIKREDLLPLAFGGNKLRSLEYLVGAALAEDADCLVTTGRRWSNHARLTAAAGARAGPAGPPRPVRPADRAAEPGHPARRAPRRDDPPGRHRRPRRAHGPPRAGRRRPAGRRPPAVGHRDRRRRGHRGHRPGAGRSRARRATADARGLAFDDVVVPSATGGTQAGLLVGVRTGRFARWSSAAWRSPRPTSSGRPSTTSSRRWPASRASPPSTTPRSSSTRSQLGDGYGRPTEAADEATRLLARTEGILVDPIYTAKALAGLVALVRSGRLDGRRVVFWHAGGTPGLFEPLDP